MEDNKYLILIAEDFCFDGQITINDYYLDLIASQDINSSDYSKKSFCGDFSLGIYEGVSEQAAIESASKQHEITKGMLKAYKLAQ